MTITTKIKDGATDEELAPYIEQGGIPNQADLNFGNEGDVLHSNKPTVTPPHQRQKIQKPEPKQPLKPKTVDAYKSSSTNEPSQFWEISK